MIKPLLAVALVIAANTIATLAIWPHPAFSQGIELAPTNQPADQSEEPPEKISARAGPDDDAAIEKRLQGIFANIDGLERVRVRVRAGVVELTGQALSADAREQAVELARQVDGVVEVKEEIVEVRDLQERLAPTWKKLRGFGYDLLSYLPLLGVAALVFAVFWLLSRWVMKWNVVFTHLASNAFLRELLRQLVRVAILLTGAVLALEMVGVTAPVTTALGAAGLVGISISFALRDTIENYITSVLLTVRQPFAPNDYIAVEGYEGHVVRLTSRATILLTLEGNHVRIPNATVFKGIITNYTRHPKRRFDFTVGIGTQENLAAYRVKVERLVRVLVANRLCDPCAKLGVLRWLERVYWPGSERITHQQLLRAMDALLPLKDEIEQHLQRCFAAATELEVVFYDITTVHIHGTSERDDDLRVYGHSKDVNGVARQYAVGVVQTAAGLPIHHEVFVGNVAETGTVRGIVERLLKRFALRRLIIVADRGMLSLANLDVLEGLRLANGRAVEYIVAVAARCYGELVQPVVDRHAELHAQSRTTGQEVFAAIPIDGDRRLIVAHDPIRLRQTRRQRARRLNPVIKQARALERKLNAQEAGKPGRGHRLSDHGARVQLAQAISEVGASRLLRLDLESPLFNWWWDVPAFQRVLALDGKLIVVTNCPTGSGRYVAEHNRHRR